MVLFQFSSQSHSIILMQMQLEIHFADIFWSNKKTIWILHFTECFQWWNFLFCSFPYSRLKRWIILNTSYECILTNICANFLTIGIFINNHLFSVKHKTNYVHHFFRFDLAVMSTIAKGSHSIDKRKKYSFYIFLALICELSQTSFNRLEISRVIFIMIFRFRFRSFVCFFLAMDEWKSHIHASYNFFSHMHRFIWKFLQVTQPTKCQAKYI